MRRVKKSIKQLAVINQDTKKDVIYATIDNVLQPIVYDRTLDNQNVIKQNVFMTPERRLARRIKASNTASTVISQFEGDNIINPIISFDYNKGFATVTSANNIQVWNPSFGDSSLRQGTESNAPSIGFEGRGVNGKYPAYFNRDNSEFMDFSGSALQLIGDFTMFFFIEPIASPFNTKQRLLGQSSNSDSFLSIGENTFHSYRIQFSPSTFTDVDIATTTYVPSSKQILATIQRHNDKFIVRENSVEIARETVAVEPFNFDQFGKIGSLDPDTFNGRLYHFSIFDGFISTELEKLENSIIKRAEQAGRVGGVQVDYSFEGDEIVDVEPI